MKKFSLLTLLLVLLISCTPKAVGVSTGIAATALINTITPIALTTVFAPELTQTPSVAVASTLTTVPTVVVIPTMNFGGQEFPDPHFSDPELFDLNDPNAPIPKFVAWQSQYLVGVKIDPQKVSDGLTYQVVIVENGEKAIALVTADYYGSIPLMIYRKNSVTNEYVWSAYKEDNILIFSDVPKGCNEIVGYGWFGGSKAPGFRYDTCYALRRYSSCPNLEINDGFCQCQDLGYGLTIKGICPLPFITDFPSPPSPLILVTPVP